MARLPEGRSTLTDEQMIGLTHRLVDTCIDCKGRIEELEAQIKSDALQYLSDTGQMADRIEELEAENKLLRDAVYIDDLTVTMQASDRSKAIAAIRRALDFLGADMLGEAKATLRTTIAELTGGKDE